MKKLKRKNNGESGGSKANKSGASLKDDVVANLRGVGGFVLYPIKTTRRAAFAEIMSAARSNPLVGGACYAEEIELCMGGNGKPLKAPFLLARDGWPTPLALLCAQQIESGSVDGKICNWLMAIQEEFTGECPAVILLCGSSMPDQIIEASRRRIDISGGRVRAVWDSVDELREWLVNGSPYPEYANSLWDGESGWRFD